MYFTETVKTIRQEIRTTFKDTGVSVVGINPSREYREAKIWN